MKQSKGNVCKIKHGKRTAYYSYLESMNIEKNGDILGYEVDKTGFPKTSKYGLIHEYVFNVSDIIEILPIVATKW